GRAADSFLGLDQHARDFQSLCESDALDGYTPGEQPGGGRARQPERAPDEPTHALRIANPYAFGVNADVVAKRALRVIHAAGKMQRPSAGFCVHILEVQARGIEYHVTLDRAEPRGKIRSAGRGVFDVHAAGDARAVQRPFEGSVDLRRAPCVEIRRKTTDDAQIQSAIQAQSDAAAPGTLNRTGNPRIRGHP